MNRKLIVLTLVLLVLAGALSWQLRLRWVESRTHERTVLAASTKKGDMQPPVAIPPMTPVPASQYNVVAQLDLFAKDRNPNVIVDPPPPVPPPPPPPPMPPLPAYFGSMAIGEPVVMLKLAKGEQKRYRAGDKVGPFQLVSFDREKVVFDWNGQIVERKLAELKEKEASPPEPVQSAPAAVAPVANNPSGTRSLSGPSADEPKVDPKLGADNGNGVRMCVAGDKSPPGTILDGYKKKITTNMFGETCMWEKINP